MAISTVSDAAALVAAVTKSGLLSADVLAEVREAAAARPDAKALARDLVKNGTLTRWQAAQLLHGYSTLVIGKYRLLDQLGAGETGRVYLAEHAQMNRRHALKILSRRQTSKPDVLKRFLDEAQRVCALDHRNLSHVYDVNQDGDKYFLVMEHVAGQDLKHLVESGGPLASARAAELLLQALDGLQHAYENQVVHGDLKPTNLIVDASGTLKITDVGQARLVEAPMAGSAEETTEAAALAAAPYRAPELLAGKQAADVRSDLYSLGNIICFLLAGKPAKDADDARRLLKGATDGAGEWVELCASLLSADPSARPTDIGALRSSLLAIAKRAADSPPPQPAEPPIPKAKKPLVARTLEASNDETEPAKNSENPLAGLTIQAPRSRAARSPVKTTASGSDPVTPAPGTVKSPAPSQSKKSMVLVIVIAALGGGVFVLGGVAIAVVVGLRWAGPEATKAVAAVKADVNQAAKAASEAAANEKALEEALAAIGEKNPVPAAEANPPPPTAVAADAPPAASAPAPAPSKPTEPAPAPEPAKPAAEPKADPAPEPVKPEPAKPEPAKPDPPKPEPAKPEPAKPGPAALKEPPKAEPTTPVAAKPAAAAAAADAFPGLRVAVSLPKLEPGMTDPPPDALASVVIGPCTPDATAQLKGGTTAQRGGKTVFELVEGKDDQSLGKWNVVMSISKTPLTIAQFSIQDKQLAFQWTPEGARNESSPYLGNCKLVLSAGTDQHEIALREPLAGESLLVDFEKPGAKVKWNLDYLPDPRKVVVEVARLGEAFKAHQFDPGPTMEGSGASTLVWTGKDDKTLFLGIEFEVTQSPKFVQVAAAGQIKAGDKVEPLIKRKLLDAVRGIDAQRFRLIKQQEAYEKAKPEGDAQKTQREAALKSVKQQQESLAATEEQLKQLQQLIEELKGKSEVHFRVYHLADDTQVDLVVASHAPAEEKKADAK